MPAGLAAALSAPLREVQATVGPGWAGAAGPAAALSGLRDALAGVSAASHTAWQQAGADWTGAGARSAGQYSEATAAAVAELAELTGELDAGTRAAGEAVTRASARLREIVERFEARAAALEPHLDTPGVAEELLAEAQRALREAVSVVEELRMELDREAAVVGAPIASSTPTSPSGFSGSIPPMPGASGAGSGASGGGAENARLASLVSPAAEAAFGAAPRPDAATFGDGVAVTLPDGTTATAPNAVAAGAVRHALTQLGVPYQWGGTTPGVGLDCSGLTQWAYREAGLDIPRLAQEQNVGAAVDPSALLPGDLVVWSGHVAMIVGDGVMIEAGDPVQLSPVRTSNAGQGFHGFFRPTG